MKFKPLLGTDLSGSVGGITASHNRGGAYFRNRSIPVDPNSPQQAAIRAFVAQLTSLWRDTLTGLQRQAWDTYAFQVPLLDTVGDPRNVGGLAMYIRSNVPRLQVALPRVDAAPTAFNLGDFTPPTFDTFAAATTDFEVTFDNTDAWANEDDSAMLLGSSRTQNASVNFFKGPYRSINPLLGDLAVPPTSPFTASAAFPIIAANRTFVVARVSRADGRLTLPFRGFGTGA